MNNDITSTFGLDYTYDGFGNMTRRVKEIGISTGTFDTQDFGVDPTTNQLLSQALDGGAPVPYEFDANGNMSLEGNRHFVFGPQNRLLEVWSASGERIAKYAYDASGYRVRTLADGMETFFVRDGSGQVLSEFRRAENDTTQPGWNKDYVYGLGQTVSVVNNTLPSPIAQPWAAAVSTSGITVDWDAPNDPDIIRYRVKRTVSDPQATKSWNVMAPTTLKVDTFVSGQVNPIEGTSITYTITAVDSAFNDGPESPLLVVRPFDFNVVGPVANFVATALDSAVRLTWSAPTDAEDDDVVGYHVWRKVDTGGTWTKITTDPITTIEYVDFDLTNGTVYYYKIIAVDNNGNSSDFNAAAEVEVTPLDSLAPAPPFGVKAAPSLNALEIVVSWNPNVGADVTRLDIYPCADDQQVVCDPPIEVYKTDPAFTAGSVTDAVVGTSPVYYHIIAHNTSPYPSTRSAQVAAIAREPGWEVPTNLQAEFWIDEHGWNIANPSGADCTEEEAHHEITVKLTWNFVGSTYVRVYRSRHGENDYTALGTVLGSDKEFIDRSPGYHDYDYYVVSTSTTGDTRESASETPVRETDDIDDMTTLYPANIIGLDGIDLGYFSTDNALSRAVQVEWMPIQESQVIGYHVYRKCECRAPDIGGKLS